MQFISIAIFPIIFHLFVINNASPLLSEKLEMDRQFEFSFQNMKKAYRMPVPRDDPCPEGTKLLVTVLSRRNGTEKRNAIRATWAADSVPNQVIRFVIGQSPPKNGTNFDEELEPEIESSLRREQSKFGDLIFYGMPDGYYNLPLKLMAIFQWQQTFCSSAKFLLKIDDDLVVDLDRLDFWIKNRYEPILEEFPLAIFGQMIVYWEKGGIAHHSTVVRKKSEKWYISPADYSPNLYPPYLNGPSYLMSTAAVGAILKRTGQVPFLPFEDLLFTGILGQKANVSLFGYESTFQIICQKGGFGIYENNYNLLKKMPCNSSHPIGDTFYPKLEPETAPNGTIRFRPELEDEGIHLQIAERGQRHCEPLDCDQPEVDEQRLNAILNAPGDGVKEEECEIELNGNCAKGMPRVAIWCRSGMEKLEEYQRFYAKLRALKCK